MLRIGKGLGTQSALSVSSMNRVFIFYVRNLHVFTKIILLSIVFKKTEVGGLLKNSVFS